MRLFKSLTDEQHELEVINKLNDLRCAVYTHVPFTGDVSIPHNVEISQRGKLTAIAEIKQRGFRWAEYPDVVLSLQKRHNLVRRAKELGNIQPLFIVSTIDGSVYQCDVTRADRLPLRRNGRTKDIRQSWDYEELVVGIPNDWFVQLHGATVF
jgi:hypothetical protein